jgi:hypothetical protein
MWIGMCGLVYKEFDIILEVIRRKDISYSQRDSKSIGFALIDTIIPIEALAHPRLWHTQTHLLRPFHRR